MFIASDALECRKRLSLMPTYHLYLDSVFHISNENKLKQMSFKLLLLILALDSDLILSASAMTSHININM